jgi:hypothetical protein
MDMGISLNQVEYENEQIRARLDGALPLDYEAL